MRTDSTFYYDRYIYLGIHFYHNGYHPCGNWIFMYNFSFTLSAIDLKLTNTLA